MKILSYLFHIGWKIRLFLTTPIGQSRIGGVIDNNFDNSVVVNSLLSHNQIKERHEISINSNIDNKISNPWDDYNTLPAFSQNPTNSFHNSLNH